MGKRLAALTCLFVMTMALGVACGGGDGDNDDDRAQPTTAQTEPTTATTGDDGEEPTASTDDDDDALSDDGSSGDVSVTADPGQTQVDVDGRTISYESAGSSFYTCDIGTDAIQVNYQTGEGQDFLLQAGRQSGDWTGSITFKEASADSGEGYGATFPADGELQVGDEALSYVGTVTRTTDFGRGPSDDLEASIAVNCASAGGDATAEIDGETFVFPASGAQSYECEITDENTFRVQINRLSSDDIQLSFDGRPQGDGVIGNVSVNDGDNTYIATLFGAPPEGLVIDGSTITFTGTFELRVNNETQGEVEGTATATCP
jgi:hypothetical protein